MATWRSGFDQNELARRIENSRTKSGPTQFLSFEHLEHAVVLNGMIIINDTIPEIEKQRILNKATFAAAEKGPITADSLLRQVHELESGYLKQPKCHFQLLSGISIANTQKVTGCRQGTCSITFGKSPSKKAQNVRNDLLLQARHSILAESPNDYLPLTVRVTARSPHEAGALAIDAIDLLRGFWNLWLNRENSWRWSSGRLKPINKILLAPIHSLHNEDGSLATESWWYDPSYIGPSHCLADRKKIESMLAFGINKRGRLRNHPYAEDVEKNVVRYCRALDSHDFNDVFLRLWGVLECLTGSVSNQSSVTTRRAAFLFQERDYSLQVLSYLASHRNQFVHAGSETNQIESMVFLLKRYVEALLFFHADNRYGFTSVFDAGEFMDLPSSKSELSRRIKRLQLARKFVVSP